MKKSTDSHHQDCHLFHKASHPVLLVQLPSNSEVVPFDNLGEKPVDGVPLFHGGDELLALLVVPQGGRLFREHLLQKAKRAKTWRAVRSLLAV